MVLCDEILRFWNTLLQSPTVPDASYNGLQVAGNSTVHKIAFGVSACQALFEKAHAAGAELICVHHGLLWGQEQALTGTFKERVKYLLTHNIGLAAYHLPLDKHPQLGNNACLMRAIGAQELRPFGNYHGIEIGFSGKIFPTPLEAIQHKLEDFCHTRAQVLAYGNPHVSTVGVVSGGAYSLLPQAIEQKLDLYITGILDEPAQEWCREGHINCLALGHYRSEKCGVQALQERTAQQFKVETEFIEIDNPL